MEDIQKFRLFNKLKSVYRHNSVNDRKESTAEHTWGSLILADFFLSKNDYGLDRLKVCELLMYHDVVEIETGDIPLHPNIPRADKLESEIQAAKILNEKLPEPLNKKFLELFNEFEEKTTKEARFAKAIDALEAVIHELDYKKDWKGWTKEFLIEKKAKLFDEFPEMKKVFDYLLKYVEENDYFEQ